MDALRVGLLFAFIFIHVHVHVCVYVYVCVLVLVLVLVCDNNSPHEKQAFVRVRDDVQKYV